MKHSLQSVIFSSGCLMAPALFAESYPYVAPEGCQTQIGSPKSSAGFLMSKDCKTVFVLPSTMGKVKTRSFAPSMNLQFCGAFEMAVKNRELAEEYERKNLILLQTLDPADPMVSVIRENIEWAKKASEEKRNALNFFIPIEAATAQISFENSVDGDWLNLWILRNQGILNTKVNFQPAPIRNGVLSFNGYSRELGRTLDGFPAVLEAQIPGYPAVKDGKVPFNGAASGQIKLSLSGACGLLKSYEKEEIRRQVATNDFDKTALHSYLVANWNYEVPIMSGVSYKAELKTDRALNYVIRKMDVSGNFSSRRDMDYQGNGSLDNQFTFQLKAYETPTGLNTFNPDENGNASLSTELQTFKNLVYEDLNNRLMEEMERAGWVTPRYEELVPVPGGYQTVEVPAKECRTKSSWFSKKTSCYVVWHKTQKWVDGITSNNALISDNIRQSFRDEMDLGVIITRSYSSSFSGSEQ